MSYDASSIQILEHEAVLERFFWAKAGELAYTYKRPLAWIERGLQACERVNVPHDYFIDRYLKKLPTPKREDVDAAMRDLNIEARPAYSDLKKKDRPV
jgi:hypothetical protein